MEAHYFSTGEEFREWLAEHHATADELPLGFYKKGSGRTGISYAEALDTALAYGWIDGIRRRIDDARYTIRFTPRRPGSIWSDVNLKRAAELEALGLMAPPGLAAFHGHDREKARQYSYEERAKGLDEAAEAALRANPAAWAFWQAQPPSYRRPAAWWVMSAKREETRQRRLATLIEDSANGLRIKEMRR